MNKIDLVEYSSGNSVISANFVKAATGDSAYMVKGRGTESRLINKIYQHLGL